MEETDNITTNANATAKDAKQEDAGNTVTAKKKTAGKRIQWLTLLVIVVVSVGGSAWLLWLQPLLKPQQSLQTQLFSSPAKPAIAMPKETNTDLDDEYSTVNIATNSVAVQAATQKEPSFARNDKAIAAQKTEPRALPVSTATTVTAPVEADTVATDNNVAEVDHTIVNHSNIEKLKQQLTQLHADLTTLHTVINTLQQQQIMQQRKQLSNDLNQLLSPNITFAQQRMLWQHIANQVQLSKAQQQQAVAMVRLAKQNIALAIQWQKTLQNMLPTLHAPTPINIIPHDYWWQKWLGEHISLHRLTSEKTQQNKHLLHTAKNVITVLSQGQWPDPRVWKSLRQQIANKSMASSLVHDVATVEKNIATMNALAKQWRDQP